MFLWYFFLHFGFYYVKICPEPPKRCVYTSNFGVHGTIAQLVEQMTFNHWVQGSSPCGPTTNSPRAVRGIFFDFLYLLVYHLVMQKYIDAHCHILSDESIWPAVACGVGQFVVNATTPDDWGKIVEVSNRDNRICGAIGVHPWYVSGWNDGVETQMSELLKNNPRLMIGEIGLDKNHPDLDLQESVFMRQLQIAHDFGRIAHIHCVGAWGKMMDILRGRDLPPAMVFHCFSGAPELAPELVKLGAFFSFGCGICDEKHIKMRDVVASVPENRILVESDAPDGAMPDKIPEIVAEIAKLRNVEFEQMADIIYNNTMGLLNGGKI